MVDEIPKITRTDDLSGSATACSAWVDTFGAPKGVGQTLEEATYNYWDNVYSFQSQLNNQLDDAEEVRKALSAWKNQVLFDDVV